MSNHNEYKRVSTTPQANTIPYADENGYISNWLNNDPVIASLKQQVEFIGTISTIDSDEDIQTVLSQFVYDTAGRLPRSGDEVAIEDVGELWLYNGTTWTFFASTSLIYVPAATSTTLGGIKISYDSENKILEISTD